METDTSKVGQGAVRANRIAGGIAIILVSLFTTFLVRQVYSAEVGVEQSPIAQQLPTLKEELRFGLRARRHAELVFIDRVVMLVKSGRLPLVMVRSTFVWSRRQSSIFPFPYFENGLRLRARRIGVKI